jgi:hypothetical protein
VVTAHFADGARPVGAQCHIQTGQQQQPLPSWHGSPLLPTVTGAHGDWVIVNVAAGDWGVEVNGGDFAYIEGVNAQSVRVAAAETKTLALTLVRGGSITGRVVDAVTGKPLRGVSVVGGPWDRSASVADPAGRYTVTRLAPGRGGVTARAEGFVAAACPPVQVRDGAVAVAGDICLSRGGWIEGRVLGPAGVAGASLAGGVMPHLETPRPAGVVWSSGRVEGRDGLGFRLGPLPPGRYQLEAWLGAGKLSKGRWRGQVTDVWVEAGKQTASVVIPVALAPRQGRSDSG